eukprot:gene33365-37701_t
MSRSAPMRVTLPMSRSRRREGYASASPLPYSFMRPDGFDALAHLRTSLAAIPRTHATRVLLKTDLRTAQHFLRGAIGLFEQTADGVLLHNQADDLSWLARQLAGLPFGFHIMTPDALRDELDTIAQRLSQIARGFMIRKLVTAGVLALATGWAVAGASPSALSLFGTVSPQINKYGPQPPTHHDPQAP